MLLQKHYFRGFCIALICFFGTISQLFAQENFLETYHPNRNKAEMAIISADYLAAANYYKIAFKSVLNPLAKDIFNALVCNLLIENYQASRSLLIKLAEKGISENYISANTIFELEKYDKFWQDNKGTFLSIQTAILQEDTGELKQKKEKLDAILRTFNSELNIRNNQLDDTTLLKAENAEKNKLLKINLNLEIDSIFNVKIREFTEILEKEDFLTEENTFMIENNKFLINEGYSIGEFDFDNTYLKRVFTRNETLNALSFITMRISQKPDSLFNVLLDKKLQEAVQKGILNPEYAIRNSSKLRKIFNLSKIELMKLSINYDSTCAESKAFYDNKTYIKTEILDQKQLSDYQKITVDFGLETFDEKRKKDLYDKFDNQYFIFTNNVRLEVMSVSNCKEANKELIGFELYKKE
jgi:hypothetical protein